VPSRLTSTPTLASVQFSRNRCRLAAGGGLYQGRPISSTGKSPFRFVSGRRDLIELLWKDRFRLASGAEKIGREVTGVKDFFRPARKEKGTAAQRIERLGVTDRSRSEGDFVPRSTRARCAEGLNLGGSACMWRDREPHRGAVRSRF
jgi:hypothetical protein